jgi:hypothetical protein
MWMIQGSLRTPNRLPKLSFSCVQQSEIFKKMTGARGPYNLGGSITEGSGAILPRSVSIFVGVELLLRLPQK